ncbi:hypothetical protein PG357_03380 [Riemerella anatipestifer]|nr:hypothetical protein [Riemerella anatipestifer]
MKKYSLITILVASTFSFAQIKTNSNILQNTIPSQTPFLDASSSSSWNGTTNIGKGLVFPRTDLTKLSTLVATPNGIGTSYPNRLDGMIVYNTATGKSAIGNVDVTSGFYYYENKSNTLSGGTWKPLGGTSPVTANIYTADGVLMGVRTVDMNGKNLQFTGNGNFGIGTDTPDHKLDVKGNARVLGLSEHSLRLQKDGATDFTDFVKRANGTFLITNNTADTWQGGLSIDSKGNVGIGTEQPQTKLDVEGSIKIADGTQQEGRVLTSDANGIASWQALSMGNKMTQIIFKNPNAIIPTVNYSTNNINSYTREIAETVESPFNEIGLNYTNESIHIPQGKYMIFIRHDISGAEYCHFKVIKASNNSTVYDISYGEWLNASFPLILDKNDDIYFEIKAYADDTYNPASFSGERNLPNPAPLFYLTASKYNKVFLFNQVTILKLN